MQLAGGVAGPLTTSILAFGWGLGTGAGTAQEATWIADVGSAQATGYQCGRLG